MAAYPTVLIIDDDPMAIRLVTDTLRQEDYVIFSAPDGPQGLRAMYEHHPDLIILDVNMPTMDGWTVCQRIREVSNVPVVMLTARDAPEEVIRGLDLGADDYVTKPFDIKVLLARVRATLRRAVADSPVLKKDVIYSDDYLSINLDERRVTIDGKAVRLTPTEFNLLAYLVDNAARVVSYRELLEQIWGFEYIDDIDYLRVYIWHLRRKLEHDPKAPTYIMNELGVGYRFEKQV
jgi:two-component system KDP operon response regulator KdpE